MRAGLSFSMCAKRRAGIPVSRSPRRLIGKMYLYSNPPVTLSAWRHLWGRQWHSFRSGPAGPASAAHRYRYRSAAQFSCVPYLPPPTPEREREKERERERERGRERTREMTKPLKLCSSAAPPLQKHSESQREVPSRGWRQGHFVPSASDTRRASALGTKATGASDLPFRLAGKEASGSGSLAASRAVASVSLPTTVTTPIRSVLPARRRLGVCTCRSASRVMMPASVPTSRNHNHPQAIGKLEIHV